MNDMLFEFVDVAMIIKYLENGKAAGLDGITGEMFKYGGAGVKRWLFELLKLCVETGEIPKD